MFATFPKTVGRWVLPMTALMVAIVTLLAAILADRECAGAMRSELMLQIQKRTLIDQTERTKVPSCGAELAYAQSLPASISLDKLVRSLQDSAKAFGVTVLSVSGEPHSANERTLESLVVSIGLHGGYAGIKSTLAEGLSRFPSASLEQLNFKRAGAAQIGVEDANVQLVFVFRPTQSASSDCRMPATDVEAGEMR